MNSEPDTFIDPENADAKRIADELFINGLLLQLHQDTPLARERRIQAVLAELKTESPTSASHAARFRFLAYSPRFARFSRFALTAAASLVLFATLTYVGISSEKSADATVQATISAMRSSGDRRYEIRSKLFTESDLGKEPMAVIDTRAPGFMLLRSKGPDNHAITVGRDGEGVWAIKRDGTVERDNPEIRWPRWAMLGDESLFADSVDQLLESMSQSYDIKSGAAATLTGKGEKRFAHLTGTKRRAAQPGPRQIDLWIDESSKIVERMEMHFDPPPAGMGGPGNPAGGGPRPGDDRDPIDRPGHVPPGRPFGPPNGPPGDRPEGGLNEPREGNHEGPRGGPPDRRPDGPQSGDDQPLDNAGRPPHREDGLPPDGLEPRGPRGDHFIGDGAGPRPLRGGPPHGPLGRPDPRRGPRGDRPPPLELLVIERVAPPEFSDGYFKAETYSAPASKADPASK